MKLSGPQMHYLRTLLDTGSPPRRWNPKTSMKLEHLGFIRFVLDKSRMTNPVTGEELVFAGYVVTDMGKAWLGARS